jgi:predicted ArsR family transcriptional regulator
LFPRCYDTFALDALEDIIDHGGPDAVGAVLARRCDKLVAQYEATLDGCCELEARVAGLTRIRDDAGYIAEYACNGDGELVLTENNCAVHKVAERYPAVCAMELELMRRVMGPDVEVTRVAHTMAGDAVCAYRIRARSAE